MALIKTWFQYLHQAEIDSRRECLLIKMVVMMTVFIGGEWMVGRYLPRVIMPAASNKHFAVMSLMALLVMIMMTILMVTDHEINLKICVHTAFDKIGCLHKKIHTLQNERLS